MIGDNIDKGVRGDKMAKIEKYTSVGRSQGSNLSFGHVRISMCTFLLERDIFIYSFII